MHLQRSSGCLYSRDNSSDSKGCKWTKHECSGVEVTGRVLHTLERVGAKNEYVVIGGAGLFEAAIEEDNQMPVYNGKKKKWRMEKYDEIVPEECKETATGVLPRFGHSSVGIGQQIYVFGGSVNGEMLNDLWKLETVDNGNRYVWTLVSDGTSDENAPTGRCGHRMVSTANGRYLLILGGTDKKTMFQDCCVFDTETGCWLEQEQLVASGDGPGPRIDFSVMPFGEDQFVFFGGLNMVAVVNDVWVLKVTQQE
eukprot:TRINITY_DN1981_c1_g1_i2.p1 TRINITY_DN1981_c1_g1~~TRINITY_DN1981_c1_g1_i2.p1  ORF type:complete len:253 (+),score=68.94 TRINITY_DN1981_c1_g1_i2:106-864(+)